MTSAPTFPPLPLPFTSVSRPSLLFLPLSSPRVSCLSFLTPQTNPRILTPSFAFLAIVPLSRWILLADKHVHRRSGGRGGRGRESEARREQVELGKNDYREKEMS
ncbi:hypothetical protein E2C01_101116 [Portunus trituberculatus]|uniref:Uncharacterized protein n=1 Tax=Portunus trituberculatus TaxID=210409 RepID=A0A5B7KET1_PORTR|nr:hypothetical protein [Portunus trituberculatus]